MDIKEHIWDISCCEINSNVWPVANWPIMFESSWIWVCVRKENAGNDPQVLAWGAEMMARVWIMSTSCAKETWERSALHMEYRRASDGRGYDYASMWKKYRWRALINVGISELVSEETASGKAWRTSFIWLVLSRLVWQGSFSQQDTSQG